jgi:ABC-type polysaccharide/polyol phosphate transport system, ATPase component
MNSPRIEVLALGKRFAHRATSAPLTWRNLFAGLRRSPRAPFWALQDVSFTVQPGEMLGIIGRNGAGKSTLLNLLADIVQPTSGRLAVRGRIGGLLELGGGFVDDLTGRENVVLAGVTAGLTRRDVYSKLDDIVGFAELAGFLDDPVRTYSTGMRMRLAFSVAVHTRPDVLLVDEFLAVGDLAFQARCRAHIAGLRQQGCAVVLVSHGMGDVRETCDRVLWLREGRVAALDSPAAVTALYESEMHERTLQLSPPPAAVKSPRSRNRPGQRVGSREMEITAVKFPGGSALRSGAALVLDISYRGARPGLAPIFVVSISRSDGTLCIDTNTQSARISTEHLPASGTIRFSIPRLELGSGRYFANVGIFDPDWSHAYDHHWEAYPFSVDGAPAHRGLLAPACKWDAPAAAVPALSRP